MKFTAEFLKYEVLHGNDSYKIVYKEGLGKSRLYEIIKIVFEYEGKFYQTCYNRSLPIIQEYHELFYADEIECEEVQKIKKVIEIEEYVPVEKFQEITNE